jgi:hypothetical protein
MSNDFSAFSAEGVTGSNFDEMNKGVTPLFKIVPVADPARSEAEGHPCFTETEEVMLLVAGDTFNVVNMPVTDDIRRRFSVEYAKWQANRDASQISGTPLSEFPMLSAAQRMELEAINIRSVEGLAGVADTNISRIMDGRIWREKAKAWLAAAKDGAVVTKFAAENERMRESMDAMQKQVAELSAQLASKSEADGKSQGRAR